MRGLRRLGWILIFAACGDSPHPQDDGDFIEVFVDVPLEVAEERDPKGLYVKARSGEIPSFTGISAPYEAPLEPELHLETHLQTAEESAKVILGLLEERGIVR